MFQLRRLFHFSTKIIVNSHVLIWNKIVNWYNIEEQTQFQLGTLTVNLIVSRPTWEQGNKTRRFYVTIY